MIGALFKNEAAIREADRRKFENLMRSSWRQAYQFAFRLTGSANEAEDLVQETYLRAFRFFYRYDEGLPFLNWLYRIMSNAHIDSMRRRARLKLTSLDAPAPNAASPLEIADSSPSIERRMVDASMGAEVEEALAKMTPEFRTAVLLADVEGMAYEEVAEAMNTSVGTVRSRIHRGRKQLRSLLVGKNPMLYQDLEGDGDEL